MIWFFKKKTGLKAVLFDIGGVVVHADLESYLGLGSDIFETQPEHIKRCAAPFVKELERGKITSIEFWDQVGRALAEEGVGKAVPAWRFKGFWEGVMRDSATVDQEVLRICRRLRGRVKLGALTNTIKEHAVFLQKLGAYEPFRPCIFSFQIGARKPDAAAYEKAAKMMKTSPSGCLLIDDLAMNIRGAEEAGMHGYLFTTADGLETELRERGLL